MKKIVTILMLVAVILVGGMTIDAKNTKKKSSKSTSSGVILKIKEIGGDITLLKNGKIMYNNKYIKGEFINNNGAYFVKCNTSGDSEGIETLFIYGDKSYMLVSNEFITDVYDDAKAYDFYCYVDAHGLKNSVSFDPSNKTITVNTEKGPRYVTLSGLSEAVDSRSVVWN